MYEWGIVDTLITKISNYDTHLTFGYWFNQDIKGCIPTSVTHLTFGYRFSQDIKECIPNTVRCDQQGVPNNITHLTLPKGYSYNNLNNKRQVSFQ